MWKEIPDWPGYFANEAGQILGQRGWVMTPCFGSCGYRQVTVRRDGVASTQLVHRLVASAFLGPCPPGMEVLHRNDDADDNRLSNLHYGTHAENVADRYRRYVPITRCRNGHDYDRANTRYYEYDGVVRRSCRACHAEVERRRKARRRAEQAA